MTEKPTQNRPKVQYRVQLEKKIDINKSYSERRNQAIALRILSYGLFGQKRYQNLYLTCSLNCFYYALKIANVIHRRVAGLAMIIRFQTAHVIEYYEEPFEGKKFGQKKYSKISIKLTKNPTEQDKNEPGYNAALNADDIEQPLTQVIARKQRPEGQRGRFQRGRRGGYRGSFRNRGGQNRDRPYQDRRYNDRRDNDRRDNDRDRTDRRERRGDDRNQDRQERVDYRKFRTYKDQHVEQDNYRRGQRRTRGNNNNYNPRQNRDNQDRTFQRTRRYQNREERGDRGPRQRPTNRYDESD